MRDYHINIFYSDEDEGYIADIPDLKACSAFGKTANETLREVQLAKEAGLKRRRPKTSRSPYRVTALRFIRLLAPDTLPPPHLQREFEQLRKLPKSK